MNLPERWQEIVEQNGKHLLKVKKFVLFLINKLIIF